MSNQVGDCFKFRGLLKEPELQCEDLAKFCGLLRIYELYAKKLYPNFRWPPSASVS